MGVVIVEHVVSVDSGLGELSGGRGEVGAKGHGVFY